VGDLGSIGKPEVNSVLIILQALWGLDFINTIHCLHNFLGAFFKNSQLPKAIVNEANF
jgi:hypothetical protein